MMLRNCIICDFCFETLNKRKIFCSKSCKQKNSYRKIGLSAIKKRKKGQKSKLMTQKNMSKYYKKLEQEIIFIIKII